VSANGQNFIAVSLAMNWDLAQALEPLVEIDPLP
jgi:hypothetical protein